MPSGGPSSDRLWLTFAASSVICLLVLLISPVKDHFREYRSYQEEYRERLITIAGSSRDLRRAREETVHVRQLWIPALDGQVDRCVSCHLGADDPRMADAPQPFALHPETPHTPFGFERFGCVSCHRGQGRATTEAAAHGEVDGWHSPLLPLGYTEASCGTCHLGDEVPEAELISTGRALIRRAGCAGCHRIPGMEGWESTAPDLDGLAEKMQPEWLLAWLRDPQSLQPGTWMPDFRLGDGEARALAAFLWAQPPRQVVDKLAPAVLPDGDYDRGRKLFRTARCISCHTIEGKGNGSAPELMGVGSKVKRRWLWAFLADPHSFQPRTEMPHYRFDDGELADLTRYLMEEMVDLEAPTAGQYRPDLRLAERGAGFYSRYGCGACHRLGGEGIVGPPGPDLTEIGDRPAELLDFGNRHDLPRRLPDWLAAKLTAPRSFRVGLRMPIYFQLVDEEVIAVVTALLSYAGTPVPESYRVERTAASYAPPGRFGALVREYRCLSCHLIRGEGGDISTAPLTAEGSKVKRQWLEDYLLLPTAIRPILTDRMVPLGMPREEAAFIAEIIDEVYLDDAIPGEIFPENPSVERIERGRRLFFQRYGCQSCHQAEGAGGYYGPPLDDSARKLKSGWIAWWLQGPQRWRDDVRCPDFGLEAEEATDLAAYLVSLGASAETAQGGAS